METLTTTRRDFGTIRLRGRIWWVRYKIDGKTFEESSGSPIQRKAEKLLDRRQAECGIGSFVEPAVKRTTFDDLARMITDDYAVNQRRSADRLAGLLKHLHAAFAGSRASSITADRLTAYLRERLDQGAAPQTVKNELSALGRAFALAERAGRVARTPEFPTITVHNTRQGFFELADLQALIRELPAPIRPIVWFLYYSGWRRGEALSLTWAQVDFHAGMLRLEPGTTKNLSGRGFPFAALPPLQQILTQQRASTDLVERRLGKVIPWVFHREGEPIQEFHKSWTRAIERAAYQGDGPLRTVVRPGLIGRLVHDLRRTAVRHLERAGVSRSVAMQLTGHKTESVYRRYAIVAEQDLRDGVAKLALLHGGPRRGTGGGQSAQFGGRRR